jgi:hypothetical protein
LIYPSVGLNDLDDEKDDDDSKRFHISKLVRIAERKGGSFGTRFAKRAASAALTPRQKMVLEGTHGSDDQPLWVMIVGAESVATTRPRFRNQVFPITR